MTDSSFFAPPASPNQSFPQNQSFPVTQSFPTTPTVPASDLRGKADASRAKTLTFPADLRKAGSNFPFMYIEVVEYPVNDRALIRDLQKESSKIDNLKAVASDLGNVNNDLVTRDGVHPPTKGKVKATIVLPITNNVTNSLGINWEMADFAGGQAALGAVKGIVGDIKHAMSGGGSIVDAARAVGSTGMDAIIAANTAILSGLLQRTVNVIANPKKQAFFNGVEPRHFQFDWIFTPTNPAEAQTVENIIKTFTKYALPELTAGSLIFNFPNEFWIQFDGVKGFPKLYPMVCVGLATNYTPNTLQLLQDGHSVQIILSVAFLETTIRTNDTPGV